MMILYHGTMAAGLTLLKPGPGGKLYLTPNEAYALFYIRDRAINWVTCAVREDGVVWYEEQFPDQLKVIYSGVCGYIYACEAAGAEQAQERAIMVAREPVSVIGATYIADAYEEIMRCVARGLVSVSHCAEMEPDRRRGLHEHMVNYIHAGGFLQQKTKKAEFLATYFPEAWREANEKWQ